MGLIKVVHKGNFNHTERFFNNVLRRGYLNQLAKYGELGVRALVEATPIDSGKTASRWTYEIQHDAKTTTISWINDNVNEGVNVAIILQYGHGTGSGGYVQGIDYINPAMKPVFDKIADEVLKGVVEYEHGRR